MKSGQKGVRGRVPQRREQPPTIAQRGRKEGKVRQWTRHSFKLGRS